jgi:flagellar hook-associated protein 2
MSSSNVNPLFGLGNNYELLIKNLISLESTKKNSYLDEKDSQQTRKSAIDSVGSKLTSLNKLLGDYQDLNSNQFSVLGATSSNEDAFAVSTSDILQQTGSYNIEIQQLAKFDNKVSAQFSRNGTDLSDAVGVPTGANELSFDLNVNGNNYTITVDSIAGKTNNEVLDAVATQINDVAGADAQASILRETSGTVRLSVRSRETGGDFQLSFSNINDADPVANLAIELGLTKADGTDNDTVIASGSTNGGRLYAANTLDAKFSLDGLQFTRSTNEIDDAITGLTLNLNKTTSGSETLTIDTNSEASVESVQNFIDTYNAAITDIRSKSFLNGESGDRGPLSRDRLFKDLTYTLRNAIIGNVIPEGVDPNDSAAVSALNIKNIFDIGLNANQDGTLYIDDESALKSALANNPDEVQGLFSTQRTTETGYTGLADRLSSVISDFVKSDGLINQLKTTIDDRIEQLNNRIQQQEEFLARREEQLREEFTQLEALSQQAQSQFQTLQSIGAGGYNTARYTQ